MSPRTGVSLLVAFSVGLTAPGWVVGQEADSAAVAADTIRAGRTGVQRPAFAGPSSAQGTLAFDDEEKGPFWRVPTRLTAPWFDWKRRLNENHGVSFGLTYQLALVDASARVSDEAQHTSSGGVVSGILSWTPWGRESGNFGRFTLIVENRHAYGVETPPQNLAFETGSIISTATKFGKFDTRALVLHYGQAFWGGRAGVVVGKIAADDYFNHHKLMHPFLNFMGFGSIITPTANWPNPGFGVGAGIYVHPQIYVKALVADAQGDPFTNSNPLDFGDDFFAGRFHKTAEVGWVPSQAESYTNRVALTVWQTDEYDGSPENYGISAVTNWTLGSWVPFLLTGWSNGQGVNVTASTVITGGLGYTMRSHDVVGSSISWARPGEASLRDQTTLEAFWRFYLAEHVAFTPNVQWVFNPALNPNEDSMVYLQFRARVDL
jgi:porin